MWNTTKKHKKYWSERRIDWHKAYFTPDHPHRQLFIDALHTRNFGSVFEIGCGAGANLAKITQSYPHTRVGGVDINPDAIEEAKKHFPPNSVFCAGSAENTFMNDKSIDVLVSDACLIYQGPFSINAVIKEMARITRKHLLMVELHEPSLWGRWKMWKRGYFAYDYRPLLRKHGFYDIQTMKIPKGMWDGTPWETHGYLITARV